MGHLVAGAGSVSALPGWLSVYCDACSSQRSSPTSSFTCEQCERGWETCARKHDGNCCEHVQLGTVTELPKQPSPIRQSIPSPLTSLLLLAFLPFAVAPPLPPPPPTPPARSPGAMRGSTRPNAASSCLPNLFVLLTTDPLPSRLHHQTRTTHITIPTCINAAYLIAAVAVVAVCSCAAATTTRYTASKKPRCHARQHQTQCCLQLLDWQRLEPSSKCFAL